MTERRTVTNHQVAEMKRLVAEGVPPWRVAKIVGLSFPTVKRYTGDPVEVARELDRKLAYYRKCQAEKAQLRQEADAAANAARNEMARRRGHNYAPITDEQRAEVVRLHERGHHNKAIARAVGISPGSVKRILNPAYHASERERRRASDRVHRAVLAIARAEANP